MIDAPVNGRPAGDVLSRVVRVKLAGRDYALPVRSIRFNREWKAQLDASTASVVDALVEAGDDWEKVLGQLARDVDPFIDLLVSYAPGVLTRDAIENMEPDPTLDVINACRGVWLAATPLVAIGIEELGRMAAQTANGGSRRMSSPPLSTAGPPTSSNGGSPTSSSSPTSTLPPTDESSPTGPASKPKSKLSGSGRSSPTTRRRSPSGGAERSMARRPDRRGSPVPRSRPQ